MRAVRWLISVVSAIVLLLGAFVIGAALAILMVTSVILIAENTHWALGAVALFSAIFLMSRHGDPLWPIASWCAAWWAIDSEIRNRLQ